MTCQNVLQTLNGHVQICSTNSTSPDSPDPCPTDYTCAALPGWTANVSNAAVGGFRGESQADHLGLARAQHGWSCNELAPKVLPACYRSPVCIISLTFKRAPAAGGGKSTASVLVWLSPYVCNGSVSTSVAAAPIAWHWTLQAAQWECARVYQASFTPMLSMQRRLLTSSHSLTTMSTPGRCLNTHSTISPLAEAGWTILCLAPSFSARLLTVHLCGKMYHPGTVLVPLSMPSAELP